MKLTRAEALSILGISGETEFAQIKLIWRRLAQNFHPDRNNSPDALERTQRINLAFETLSRLHDSGELYGPRVHRTQADDAMEAYHRQQRQWQQERERYSRMVANPKKGKTIRRKCKVTMHEAAFGFERTFEFDQPIWCGHCGGHGQIWRGETVCPSCKGSGWISQAWGGRRYQCHECDSSGKVRDLSECDHCNGTGEEAATPVKIVIKFKGAHYDGQVFKKMGYGGASGFDEDLAGDLVITLEVESSEFHYFSRPFKDSDELILTCTARVSLWDWITGGDLYVPTLDGVTKVEMRPRQQACTIPNQGWTRRDAEGNITRAGLRVNIEVIDPPAIDDETKKMLKQLRAQHKDDELTKWEKRMQKWAAGDTQSRFNAAKPATRGRKKKSQD